MTRTSATAVGPDGGYGARRRRVQHAYLLWWFFGLLGVHRFYLGRTRSATVWLVASLTALLVAALLTRVVGHELVFVAGGLLEVPWFVDAFLIPRMARERDDRIAVARGV